MDLVLAYHVIITCYGFWLPNDTRGSWSDFVGAWELVRFGRATKVDTHHSVAHVPHDRELRRAAKRAPKYPAVRFTGRQALSVVKGFATAIREGGYVLHACSILPDHVHFALARHQRIAETVTAHLKAQATRQLRADGLHPFERFARPDGSVPSVWAESLWKVFLFDAEDIRRASVDPQQLNLLDSYAVSKRDAEDAARASGLDAVRVEYFLK